MVVKNHRCIFLVFLVFLCLFFPVVSAEPITELKVSRYSVDGVWGRTAPTKCIWFINCTQTR